MSSKSKVVRTTHQEVRLPGRLGAEGKKQWSCCSTKERQQGWAALDEDFKSHSLTSVAPWGEGGLHAVWAGKPCVFGITSSIFVLVLTLPVLYFASPGLPGASMHLQRPHRILMDPLMLFFFFVFFAYQHILCHYTTTLIHVMVLVCNPSLPRVCVCCCASQPCC